MSNATQQKIQKVTNQIVKEYRPEKIILFGSFAFGRPTKDSDLDLFIIKRTTAPMGKRLAKVEKILLERTLPLDILIYTPAEVKRRLSLGDFFIEDIIQKGKILYANK